MKESYQEEMYNLLSKRFSRKQMMSLGTELNLNLSSVSSYIHSWIHRGLIKKIKCGEYEKLTSFTPVNLNAIKSIPAPVPLEEKKEEEPEADVVLEGFSVKAATDTELLQELVSRGFSWDNMQKTTVIEFPFNQFTK